MAETVPSKHGSVSYRHKDSSYFEKRGLRRYAGVWSLWALGVGAVISGHFSGWNLGLGAGGFGGMLIATVVMMPLLAFWAMMMSLLGGGIFVWLALGIPPLTYVQRLQEVTPITDLWIGLIKAPVFGFIIALSGCFQGMLVENDSEEVGKRTTTAVVQSIFLVIVLDAVFAVFFSSIGWS